MYFITGLFFFGIGFLIAFYQKNKCNFWGHEWDSGTYKTENLEIITFTCRVCGNTTDLEKDETDTQLWDIEN